MICKWCSEPLIEGNFTKKQWSYRKSFFKNKGYVWCSSECGTKGTKKIKSVTMAETNRKYASKRMKRNNPMHKEEIREKVSKSLKGRVISNRGGNGTGMTIPQKLLFDALSNYSPIEELAIPTKQPRGSGYPPNYKVDIGVKGAMLAIEVDGFSHKALKIKEKDYKKTKLLESLGWTVIRFKNEEVIDDVQSCYEKVVDYIENGT